MYDKLKSHIGHHIECVCYGEPENPDDICIECIDCNEVLISAETLKCEKEEKMSEFYSHANSLNALEGGLRSVYGNSSKYQEDVNRIIIKSLFHLNDMTLNLNDRLKNIEDIEILYPSCRPYENYSKALDYIINKRIDEIKTKGET